MPKKTTKKIERLKNKKERLIQLQKVLEERIEGLKKELQLINECPGDWVEEEGCQHKESLNQLEDSIAKLNNEIEEIRQYRIDLENNVEDYINKRIKRLEEMLPKLHKNKPKDPKNKTMRQHLTELLAEMKRSPQNWLAREFDRTDQVIEERKGFLAQAEKLKNDEIEFLKNLDKCPDAIMEERSKAVESEICRLEGVINGE